MKTFAIIAAIIVAGATAAFGPAALAAYQQAQRDDSAACAAYRMSAINDRLAELNAIVGGKSNVGTTFDRAATERQRLAGNCSY